jgi:PAS domain S-box-containing protein
MRLVNWGITRRLAYRITIPLVITILIMGIGLYSFNLRLMSDFAARQIEESLSGLAHEIYNICDRSFTVLLQHGLLNDEKSLRIYKASTIGQIEDFLRKNDIGGQIFDKDRTELLSYKIPSKFLKRSSPNREQSVISVIKHGGTEYYVTRTDFEPWGWHVVIFKEASEFSNLIRRVRIAYIITGAILLLSGALLLYSINRAVKRPVKRIIDDIAGGKRPEYKGIVEFEFLSDNIGQMMDAIKESEKTIRSIAAGLGEGVYVVNEAGSLVFMNPAAERLLGWKETELLGSFVHDIFHYHKSDRRTLPSDECLVLSIIKSGDTYYTEDDVFCRRNGSLLPVSYVATPLRKDGKIVGAVTAFQDITERKRTVEALRESERKFRAIFDHSFQFIGLMTTEGTLIEVNRSALSLGGVEEADAIGKPLWEARWWSHSTELQEEMRAAVLRARQGEFVRLEATHPAVDGTLHCVDFSVKPVMDEGGKVVLLIPEGRDITERKRAEEERARLVTAVEQAVEAIFITDANWIIHYVNPAFERMSGYDGGEIIGEHICILESDKHDKPFYDRIRDRLVGGEVWSGRLINKRRDGTYYEAEATASPVRDNSGAIINYVGIHRDITHEVKLEKELRQAQKMEAIGTLAGGIAHDFNNILTAVMGFTEMALSKVPEGRPARRDLERVLDAGARATDLVRQILTFSRPTELERKPIAVAPLVKEALKLLRSSLPTTIDIQQDIVISREEGVVLGDPTEIHQVLMNLCTNAAHAMRAKGGKLSVELAAAVADASLVSRYPDLRPGPYVRLTVSDTGHGIDAAVMERIFDPYFTTKEPGEGTGLGLSVVQGIVKSYGGAITVDSKPGKGSTFHVFLPRIEEVIAPEAGSVELPATGDERILFVDDEKALVDLGEQMLAALGYRVTAKTSSAEALETFRAQPDAFDLVITDMTMPAPTGMELAKELMAIRPDIPIILCTGFRDLVDGKQCKAIGVRELLLKPYLRTDLARTIRKVLDQSSS